MGVIDDEGAAQPPRTRGEAAYFRTELDAARRDLADRIVKRRAILEQRPDAKRVRAEVHSAEAEVRYLERLIARLDDRFAAQWDGET